MAETLFSCPCGTLLKVYGDDQAGSEIICPSCRTAVTVPSVGQARVAPRPTDESAPERGQNKTFAIIYLSVIFITTLALVKYLLLPVRNNPEVAVETTVAVPETVNEPVPKKAVRTAAKKPTKRGREYAAPIETPLDSEAPEVKTSAKPDENPVADSASSTAVTLPSETPASREADPAPVAIADPSREPAAPEPATAPDSSDVSSPYAHIANKNARKALEFALINTRHIKATWTAELFLNSAEKAAKGDPVILNEVKKLREKIARMRSRAP